MNGYQDASNRLTFNFYDIEGNQYKEITSLVAQRFNLTPSNELIVGFDEIFQDYKFGNLTIGLEWDIWLGYIINAKSEDSEPLVREIAGFINERLEIKEQNDS